MYELKGKVPFLFFIALLVIIILISNLGHNFKTDVFSYDHTISISNTLLSKRDKAKQSNDYILSSSNYITSFLKNNNIQPLSKNNYIEEWPVISPYYNFSSSLEVVSRYGRTIKKYVHGKDFFEDFRGLYSHGIVKGKATYLEDSLLENKYTKGILLTDEYHNKPMDRIISLDSNMLLNGISAVISPSHTRDLLYESGLYNISSKNIKNGMVKLVVLPDVFSQLKQFSQKGCIIKIKAGTELKLSHNRNIYGILKGKNSTYKPLIIACFYDSTYKTDYSSELNNSNYALTPSILMESIRGIQTQRFNKPDRSIIFVFLSGYANNKEGLSVFLNKKIDGDIVILDNFGIDYKNILSFTKLSKNLSMTIEHFAKENDFEIISKNINTESTISYVQISALNLEKDSQNEFQYLYNSYKFLLSLIEDECYNLNFLSGNVREIRTFKRFIRAHSTSLSILSLFLLIIIIFKKNDKRNNN